jgi:hypothetical protein
MNTDNASKNWLQRHKILSGILMIVFFIILIGSFGEGNTTNPTVKNTTTENVASSQPAEPPIEITAIALYNEFETNTVAAQQKYANKLLKVSGTIDTIGTDIIGAPYVTLRSNNEFISALQCAFDRSDADTLVNLKKDQRVVLSGMSPSKTINILMQHCQVVSQ